MYALNNAWYDKWCKYNMHVIVVHPKDLLNTKYQPFFQEYLYDKKNIFLIYSSETVKWKSLQKVGKFRIFWSDLHSISIIVLSVHSFSIKKLNYPNFIYFYSKRLCKKFEQKAKHKYLATYMVNGYYILFSVHFFCTIWVFCSNHNLGF